MTSPAVTVITAAYNSARTLRVAIASLVAQTFDDWEAWVIGDGCTDDSEAVVQSFRDPRLKWLNLATNHRSPTYANNEGLRRAKGRYVAYLGHDDIWLPNHLAVLIRCIESTGADLVHSIAGCFGADRLEICVGPPKECRGYDGHHVPPSCLLHQRGVAEEIGYWADASGLAGGVDVDYLARVCRAGKRIACCEQFTVIKVASRKIGLYSLAGETPQDRYWQRVQTDLPSFQQELLGLVGAELARCRLSHPPLSVAVEQVARVAWYEFRRVTVDWPVFSQFWVWRFQRRRRATLPLRGLPRTFLS